MPWKGPRGGVYNWTDRELRNIYKKLVAYGESNQPTAAWRLLNQGKYKYMIYPWYRAQLYSCIAFKPPCVYTSHNAIGSSPTGFYSGTMTITDIDTSTVLASDTWENAIIALQDQGYDTWGVLMITFGTAGGPTPINFRLVLYVNATAVPNWSVSFSGGPQQTLVFGPEFCTCPTNYAESSITPWTARGASSASDCEFVSGFYFGLTDYNVLITMVLPAPIKCTNDGAVELIVRAMEGSQATVVQTDQANGTAGLLFTSICRKHTCARIGSFGSRKIGTAGYTNDLQYGLPNCTIPCTWYNTFVVAVGSGATINSLPADDPSTWATIASIYECNILAYYDSSYSQVFVTIVFPQSTYIDLPFLNVDPSGPYMDRTNYYSLGACDSGCMQTTVSAFDQYIDKLGNDITTINFVDYIGMSLDLGDMATASAILTNIYSTLYGPACYVVVEMNDMFDYQITVYNAYSAGPGSTVVPYVYSSLGSSYSFSQITCP